MIRALKHSEHFSELNGYSTTLRLRENRVLGVVEGRPCNRVEDARAWRHGAG